MKEKHGVWYYLVPENDAEWVMLARKKLDLNQMELAYLTGVHNSVISRIENGTVPCSEKIRRTLVKELKNKYHPVPGKNKSVLAPARENMR
ncbi:MAG: helix-turn-helix transcriptional regulator [Bacillaceae bacterium]|nr:helix-turn-helix transcriptional regulator [Bacillaceae bacterium]